MILSNKSFTLAYFKMSSAFLLTSENSKSSSISNNAFLNFFFSSGSRLIPWITCVVIKCTSAATKANLLTAILSLLYNSPKRIKNSFSFFSPSAFVNISFFVATTKILLTSPPLFEITLLKKLNSGWHDKFSPVIHAKIQSDLLI